MNGYGRYIHPERATVPGEYTLVDGCHRIIDHHRFGDRCVRVLVDWDVTAADSRAIAEILTTGIGWAPLWTYPTAQWWTATPPERGGTPPERGGAARLAHRTAEVVFDRVRDLLGTHLHH